MEEFQEFLKKTECHFNWNLTAIDVTDLSWVEKFRNKIEENQSLDDPSDLIWPLKLTYAFELLTSDEGGYEEIIDEVITEIKEAKDGLTSKYRTSYEHIAYALKAFVLLKSNRECTPQVANLIKLIKPISEMSLIEKSAVLAMQAQVLRYYGPNGTYRCVPLQREAIRLNPDEIEFKLSLVVSMNRKRHYDRSLTHKTTWSVVEEPVNILEQLLNHPNLTEAQRVSCEYFLAVAYNDFLAPMKRFTPEYEECKIQVLKSCEWLLDNTKHPQIMSFCADRFFNLQNNQPKGISIIKAALKQFPDHVGVNTAASKFYEKTQDFISAAKHAQIALDGGGFGAAWLLLQQKTYLNQEFDDVEYFNHLLQTFPRRYKIQIHLNASLYYLQSKHNVAKGAHHIEMALIEDPSYESLKKTFSHWIKGYVCPLELAYSKIIEELKLSSRCKEDLSVLLSAKAKIEEVADVETFNLAQNNASVSRGMSSNRTRGNHQSSRNRGNRFALLGCTSGRSEGGTDYVKDAGQSGTASGTSGSAGLFHQRMSPAYRVDVQRGRNNLSSRGVTLQSQGRGISRRTGEDRIKLNQGRGN